MRLSHLAAGCSLLLMLSVIASAQGTCPAGTPNAGMSKCYFIAANGSDSNAGDSEAAGHPFAHVPGMPNCAANCATAATSAGTGYIFRGGDTWHGGNSTLTPYIGPPTGGTYFSFNHAGASVTCQLDSLAGTIVKTGCIYFGVDTGWFSGTSWTRPQFNWDNPVGPSVQPASCTYSQSASNLWFYGSSSGYTIVDSLEFQGQCSNTVANSATITPSGPMFQITNCYFHNKTLGTGANSGDGDQFADIAFATPGGYLGIDHNVFDNSDGTCGNFTCSWTNGTIPDWYATGKALGAGTDIGYNVFNWISNVYVGGAAPRFHDNYLAHINEGPTGTHGNTYEQQAGAATENDVWNNLAFETPIGQGWDMNCAVSTSCNYFNNVQYFYRPAYSGTTPIPDTNGSSCFLLEDANSPSGTRNYHFWNNTVVAGCNMSAKNITANVDFKSNQLVGMSPNTLSGFSSASNTDNGGQVIQSASQASTQGYSPSTFFAPPSGGSTIHAGVDNTTSCNALSYSTAKAGCLGSLETFNYNTANHTISVTAGPMRPTGQWDSGAYQFVGPNLGSTVETNTTVGANATVR